jgi:hypothetical protein
MSSEKWFRLVLGAVVLMLAGGPPALAGKKQSRTYTLSVSVSYGQEPSRRGYLEEIQRKLESWIAASGPLHAPSAPGSTDLHLEVILDEVDRGRGYPEMSGERDVFVDMPTSVTSPYVYHTRFEMRAALRDPLQGDLPLAEDQFTIYNETRETKVVSNPRERSWNDNMKFMVKRLERFLDRHRRTAQRHLREHPRPAPTEEALPR